MLTLSTICPQKNDIYNKNNTNNIDNFKNIAEATIKENIKYIDNT